MQFWCGTPFMKRPAEAPAVARMVDEAGYDGMICADHLIYPRELRSPYPSPSGKPGWAPETPWPDTWVLIGAMAAVTTRLRFSNAVYIAPARPLLEVAKQVATAASLAEGRVSLGVGIGWMREEYELLGQQFSNRGKRLDEMIPALRALWRGSSNQAWRNRPESLSIRSSDWRRPSAPFPPTWRRCIRHVLCSRGTSDRGRSICVRICLDSN